jgi:hypothetical protein
MPPLMATEQVSLEPVDMADVTILVDNAIDILAADTAVATRQPLAYEWSQQQHQLRSEHGYSLVLTVQRNGQSDTILYDAGLGRDTAVNNMDLLGIKPSDFRTMVRKSWTCRPPHRPGRTVRSCWSSRDAPRAAP